MTLIITSKKACGRKWREKYDKLERIKAMSMEEMAHSLLTADCQMYCAFTKNGRCNSNDDVPCENGVIKWLNSEVEE